MTPPPDLSPLGEAVVRWLTVVGLALLAGNIWEKFQ